MKSKAVTVIVYLFYCTTIISGSLLYQNNVHKEDNKRDNAIDVTDFSVYYDLHTNETIRKMLPRPWYRPGWRLRLPFTGGPCECENLKCTCCTGIRIEAFSFDRRSMIKGPAAHFKSLKFPGEMQEYYINNIIVDACAILKFEPEEAIINLEVKMSNNSVLMQMFSASNPPPFCVPIPLPYLPPGLVDMCIRLFDVAIVQQKLHICMDMDTRIDMAPVLILHFDCMDMGLDGVSLSKPGSGINVINILTDGDTNNAVEPTQVNADVYDPVTEDPNYVTTSERMFKNTIRYI